MACLISCTQAQGRAGSSSRPAWSWAGTEAVCDSCSCRRLAGCTGCMLIPGLFSCKTGSVSFSLMPSGLTFAWYPALFCVPCTCTCLLFSSCFYLMTSRVSLCYTGNPGMPRPAILSPPSPGWLEPTGSVSTPAPGFELLESMALAFPVNNLLVRVFSSYRP